MRSKYTNYIGRDNMGRCLYRAQCGHVTHSHATIRCTNCHQKICARGHDKDIVGRYAGGGCIACAKENRGRQIKADRRRWQLNKYDLTPHQYAEMLLNQNGGCAICGAVPTDRPLSVDHSHHTDKVRGLLCSRCNSGIGFFKDNPNLLRNAVNYLIPPTFMYEKIMMDDQSSIY